MPQKNVNIEFMRIIACLFVIVIHLSGTYTIWNEVPDYGIMILGCMVRGAVPLFFMITGYFVQSGKSVMGQYKRLLRNVLLPVLATIIFAGVLIPVLMKYVLGANEDVPTLAIFMQRILSGSIDKFSNCFHLWYIIELIKCYLMLPLVQMVCTREVHAQKVRRMLLLIGFYAGVIITTKDLLISQPLGLFSYMPITVCMWYLLLGYEMKVLIETHEKSIKGVIGGLLLFVIGAIGVSYFTYTKDYLVNGTIMQTYYNYGFIFVAASVVGLFYAVSQLQFSGIHQWIIKIGGATFGIYLIHPVVYSVIWHLGIEKLIPIVGLKVFLVFFILLTFAGSLIGVLILQWILKFISDRKIRLQHQNQQHQ